MRIVYFGTPDEAARILKKLIDSKADIVGVVTQPDRPRGRGLKLEPSPVKELALRAGLPVLQPEKARDRALSDMIASLRPDIGIVVAYGNILPKNILDIPKHGFINIHASLLPKFRGAAPVQWAIMKGEKETGASIFRLTEGLDRGDVIVQEKIVIAPDDNLGSLSRKIFSLGGDLLFVALKDIESGSARPVKQDEAGATWAPKISRELSSIDWKRGADEIKNLVRAMDPHPGAHTFYKKSSLKIFRASRRPAADGPFGPGSVTGIVKNLGFTVRSGDGDLLVEEVQPESKKRMSGWDFVVGHRVKPGDTLPS